MNNEIDHKITDSEWEVMRVAWAQEKVTSNEIINVLQQTKDWKPATTKTFIGRLVKKGMLHTETEGKKYLYSALVNESEITIRVLNELLDRMCDKQVGNNIVNLISNATLSYADIEKMEELLELKKKTAVAEVPCSCIPGQCKCTNHSCSTSKH